MKKRDRKNWERLISEAGATERSKRLVQSAIASARESCSYLRVQVTTAVEEFRNALRERVTEAVGDGILPTFDEELSTQAGVYRAGGYFTLLVELLVGGYLFATSINANWVIGILAGVFFAAGLCVMYKAFLAAACIRANEPLASLRRLRWVSIAGTILVTVLLIPLLVTRVNPSLGSWLWLTTTAGAILLPLVAAGFLAIADILDKPNHLFRRFKGLLEEYRETLAFREGLGEEPADEQGLDTFLGALQKPIKPSPGPGEVYSVADAEKKGTNGEEDIQHAA